MSFAVHRVDEPAEDERVRVGARNTGQPGDLSAVRGRPGVLLGDERVEAHARVGGVTIRRGRAASCPGRQRQRQSDDDAHADGHREDRSDPSDGSPIRIRYQTAVMAYTRMGSSADGSSGSGIVPVIVVPSPGADTTVTLPPKAPRRSAMLMKP